MVSQEQVDVLSFLLDKYPKESKESNVKIEKFEEVIKDQRKNKSLLIIILILLLLIAIFYYFGINPLKLFSKN